MEIKKHFPKTISFSVSGPIASQTEIDLERVKAQKLRTFFSYLGLPLLLGCIWLGWNTGRIAIAQLLNHSAFPFDWLAGGSLGLLVFIVPLMVHFNAKQWFNDYLHRLSPLGPEDANSATKLFRENPEFEEYRQRVVAHRKLCKGDIEFLHQYKTELLERQAADEKELAISQELKLLADLNKR